MRTSSAVAELDFETARQAGSLDEDGVVTFITDGVERVLRELVPAVFAQGTPDDAALEPAKLEDRDGVDSGDGEFGLGGGEGNVGVSHRKSIPRSSFSVKGRVSTGV